MTYDWEATEVARDWSASAKAYVAGAGPQGGYAYFRKAETRTK